MCLLTFLPEGVMPDPDALRRGAERNPDGHGLAIVAGDRLIVRRGMSSNTMIDKMVRLRQHHLDGPALFHSRLATHGRRTLANCHPFPVGGDRRTVLAHNGILPRQVQPGRADTRSDTRIAAEEFPTRFGPAHLARVRHRLEQWITPFNKIVILTVDPGHPRQAYILNEHAGTWHDGAWYSNHDYQPRPRRPPARTAGQPSAQLPGQYCPRCGDPIDTATDGCPWCWWSCTGGGHLPNDCPC